MDIHVGISRECTRPLPHFPYGTTPNCSGLECLESASMSTVCHLASSQPLRGTIGPYYLLQKLGKHWRLGWERRCLPHVTELPHILLDLAPLALPRSGLPSFARGPVGSLDILEPALSYFTKGSLVDPPLQLPQFLKLS